MLCAGLTTHLVIVFRVRDNLHFFFACPKKKRSKEKGGFWQIAPPAKKGPYAVDTTVRWRGTVFFWAMPATICFVLHSVLVSLSECYNCFTPEKRCLSTGWAWRFDCWQEMKISHLDEKILKWRNMLIINLLGGWNVAFLSHFYHAGFL